MQLLVFNAGSSSLKFDLLDAAVDSGRAPPRRIAAGAFLDAADGSGQYVLRPAVTTEASGTRVDSLADAAEFTLQWLANPAEHGRNLLAGVAATVHRIVHGGERFRGTTKLGDAEIAALTALSPLAPLHNPPALSVIDAVRRRLDPGVPVVGVFDTTYYADLPEAAYRYAVPSGWRTEFGVRRYGFHGLAHRYLCQRACAHLETPPATARLVSLQLGRGCSVTATAGGRAQATSMGFTPLEGLVMGTRSGDIDPGAVLYVMERSGMSAAEMSRALNEQSGLLGLSGRSADMRELVDREQRGDADAAVAVEIFCRRARHYLAAFVAELGGVDAIVYGGGIGENSPEIRRRIAGGLKWAGIELDVEANGSCVGTEANIALPQSRAAIWVVPVDEASIIAGEAVALLAR
ncbi:MAG TPA: acetate/propionate family kinase [Steroidobacteraceae bacterium]|nr:acetate/propionate family kinase [Steroidobacteraceae bacterium]